MSRSSLRISMLAGSSHGSGRRISCFVSSRRCSRPMRRRSCLAARGDGSSPEGQRRGGGGGGLVRQERQTLTQGIMQMSEDGQELWFTEMHLDLSEHCARAR